MGSTAKIAVAEYGISSSFAITTTGQLYAWGSNTYGQLGLGAGTTSTTTPTLVSLRWPAVSIAATDKVTLALLDNGSVWAWGDNTTGGLGTGSTGSFKTLAVGVQTKVGQLFPAEVRGNNFDDCQYGIMATTRQSQGGPSLPGLPVVAGQPAQVRWAAGRSGLVDGELVDALGRRVRQVHWPAAQLTSGAELGPRGLPPGAYGLRLHAPGGSSTTLRPLVQ